MRNVCNKCVEVSHNVYMEAYDDSISLFNSMTGQEVFIHMKFFKKFMAEFNQMAVEVLCNGAKNYEPYPQRKFMSLEKEIILDQLSVL